MNDGFGFIFGEDSGNPFASFGANKAEIGFINFKMQDVAVEKEDCADNLVLSGGGGFAVYDKVGDKFFDFLGSHFFGVAFVVEEDVFANPVDVCFFGARRILFEADVLAVLVEKFFGFGWGLHFLPLSVGACIMVVMQSIRYYTAKWRLSTSKWGVIQMAV